MTPAGPSAKHNEGVRLGTDFALTVPDSANPVQASDNGPDSSRGHSKLAKINDRTQILACLGPNLFYTLGPDRGGWSWDAAR